MEICLSLLRPLMDHECDWFTSYCSNLVSDELKTKFCLDVWMGFTPLSVSFERLLFLSEQNSQLVGSLGSWVGDAWVSSFRQIQFSRVWEEELLEVFLDLI